MSGRIVLKHLEGSTLAGLKAEFSGPVVKIGASAASHICFDPDDDPAVVSNHAELRIGPSGVVVAHTPNSGPISVNAAAVTQDTPLKPGDVVMLGDDGPRFEVITAEASDDTATTSPNTLVGTRHIKTPPTGDEPKKPSPPPAPPSGSPQTVVGKRMGPPVPPPPPSAPKAGPDGLPPVRLNLGGGNKASASPRQPPPPPPPQDSGKRSKQKKQKNYQPAPKHEALGLTQRIKSGGSVGMNTLMGVVNRATAQERRKQMRLMIAGLLIVLVGGAIGTVILINREPDNNTVRSDGDKKKQVVKNEDVDWGEVSAKVRPSSCIVLLRLPDGVGKERTGAGTAWSVGEGVFATNSHVAEQFMMIQKINAKLGAGKAALVIRTPGEEPKDMVVTKVKLHPGYVDWRRLIGKYNPYIVNNDAFLASNTFPSCDVALMYIDESDFDKQPEPLKLASQETMDELQVGDPIATFGYPTEGVNLNATKPEPESKFGQLAKAGSYFLESSSPGKAALFWYNWGAAGGASGSPIVNKDGEVVALLSAGDVLDQTMFNRVGRDVTVGPHVRFVKELLEGTAEKAQRERTAKWEAAMKPMHAQGLKSIGSLAQHCVKLMVGRVLQLTPKRFKLKPAKKEPFKLTLQARGGNGQAQTVVNLPKGEFIFVAVATNGPNPIGVGIGRQVKAEEAQSYFSMDLIDVKTGGNGTLRVIAGKGAPDGPIQVSVYPFELIRFDKAN